MPPATSPGITRSFPRLCLSGGLVTVALLTLAPRPSRGVRLACLIHAANVHSEPGSNPSKWPSPKEGPPLGRGVCCLVAADSLPRRLSPPRPLLRGVTRTTAISADCSDSIRRSDPRRLPTGARETLEIAAHIRAHEATRLTTGLSKSSIADAEGRLDQSRRIFRVGPRYRTSEGLHRSGRDREDLGGSTTPGVRSSGARGIIAWDRRSSNPWREIRAKV